MMRRLATCLLLLGVACTGLTVMSTPAQAGTSATQKIVTVKRPYTKNWVYRSASLRACLFVAVSGTLQSTRRYAYYATGGAGWDTRTYVWSKSKLLDPRVSVTGWPLSGSGCDSTRRVSFKKLTLSQSWYEGRCTLSAQVSVGAPWSISATPTYSCGSHRVARRVSSADAPGSRMVQTNAGSPAYFTGELLSPAGTHNAFRANVSVVAYRRLSDRTISDSWATKGGVGYIY